MNCSASPHFGERFARHWMDVVRYTDTYGYEWDNPAKGSHEYRDYLIRAFNGDVALRPIRRANSSPGDLLPKPRINADLGINESLIGPMFYHMGEHRHGSSLEFNGVHQEMVNNKIEAFSKAFLATTVACARCHDHKLEAVSQRDYYALAAVFMTPRWTSRRDRCAGKNDDAIRQLSRLRDEICAAEMAGRGERRPRQPDDWAAAGWQKRVRRRTQRPRDRGDRLSASPARRRQGDVGQALDGAGRRVAEAARTEREKHNQAFTFLADFTKPGCPGGWVTEGDGIRLRDSWTTARR